MNFVSSYLSTNSGVATVVIENEKLKAVVVNMHCPNDNRAFCVLIKKVDDKAFELLNKHPHAFVIMGGDFNVGMSENDSLNIVKAKQKSYLTDCIRANNSNCGVMNAYRFMEADRGYLWNR
jgi:hypothetical protein